MRVCVFVVVLKRMTKPAGRASQKIKEVIFRQNEGLHVPFAKCQLGAKSPNIFDPKVFNKPPTNIKQSEMRKKIQIKLKGFLVINCYCSLSDFINA